ncbi:heavy-metal-associated domain-containing protein [Granulibacter bethesdensis]|nr:heavy metal-associated domain-containing protein [Granulibacter bethesdensis]
MTPTTILSIKGMTCEGCVNAVRRILLAVPGVSDASVTLGRAEISGGEAARLMEAVRDAGFGAEILATE